MRSTGLVRMLRRWSPLLAATAVVGGYAGYEHLDGGGDARAAAGEGRVCQVRSVYDGDTATLACKDGKLKVRVWGIDAPEMKQAPWGTRARDALRARLPAGSEVRVEVVDTDRYGRAVARLYQGNTDIGLAQVRDGWGAIYERYNDSAHYRQEVERARARGVGIWAEEGVHQRPWDWRKVNP